MSHVQAVDARVLLVSEASFREIANIDAANPGVGGGAAQQRAALVLFTGETIQRTKTQATTNEIKYDPVNTDTFSPSDETILINTEISGNLSFELDAYHHYLLCHIFNQTAVSPTKAVEYVDNIPAGVNRFFLSGPITDYRGEEYGQFGCETPVTSAWGDETSYCSIIEPAVAVANSSQFASKWHSILTSDRGDYRCNVNYALIEPSTDTEAAKTQMAHRRVRIKGRVEQFEVTLPELKYESGDFYTVPKLSSLDITFPLPPLIGERNRFVNCDGMNTTRDPVIAQEWFVQEPAFNEEMDPPPDPYVDIRPVEAEKRYKARLPDLFGGKLIKIPLGLPVQTLNTPYEVDRLPYYNPDRIRLLNTSELGIVPTNRTFCRADYTNYLAGGTGSLPTSGKYPDRYRIGYKQAVPKHVGYKVPSYSLPIVSSIKDSGQWSVFPFESPDDPPTPPGQMPIAHYDVIFQYGHWYMAGFSVMEGPDYYLTVPDDDSIWVDENGDEIIYNSTTNQAQTLRQKVIAKMLSTGGTRILNSNYLFEKMPYRIWLDAQKSIFVDYQVYALTGLPAETRTIRHPVTNAILQEIQDTPPNLSLGTFTLPINGYGPSNNRNPNGSLIDPTKTLEGWHFIDPSGNLYVWWDIRKFSSQTHGDNYSGGEWPLGHDHISYHSQQLFHTNDVGSNLHTGGVFPHNPVVKVEAYVTGYFASSQSYRYNQLTRKVEQVVPTSVSPTGVFTVPIDGTTEADYINPVFSKPVELVGTDDTDYNYNRELSYHIMSLAKTQDVELVENRDTTLYRTLRKNDVRHFHNYSWSFGVPNIKGVFDIWLPNTPITDELGRNLTGLHSIRFISGSGMTYFETEVTKEEDVTQEGLYYVDHQRGVIRCFSDSIIATDQLHDYLNPSNVVIDYYSRHGSNSLVFSDHEVFKIERLWYETLKADGEFKVNYFTGLVETFTPTNASTATYKSFITKRTYEVAVQPPSFYLEKQFKRAGGNATIYGYSGCKIQSFSLSFKGEGPIDCTLNIVGATELIGQNTQFSDKIDIMDYLASPFYGSDVAILLNGKQAGNITNMSLAVNRMLSTDGYVVDADEVDIIPESGFVKVGGSMTILFTDTALFTKAKNEEIVEVTIDISKGAFSDTERDGRLQLISLEWERGLVEVFYGLYGRSPDESELNTLKNLPENQAELAKRQYNYTSRQSAIGRYLNEKLKITMPYVLFKPTSPTVAGPMGMMASFTFTASYKRDTLNNDYVSPLRVELWNCAKDDSI